MLKERREKGGFDNDVQSSKGSENVDVEDLLIRDNGRTSGHEYKLKKDQMLKQCQEI